MKALVYQGPGRKDWVEKQKPGIEKPSDVIVRVTKTTICGTDLHILKGDVPAVTEGRTLGHEGVGIVEEVGGAVTNFKPGDAVLISCVTSCGRCPNCKRQLYAHCADGGWILGHMIDGTQAEYVRIPHGDNSLYPIPPGADEEAQAPAAPARPRGEHIRCARRCTAALWLPVHGSPARVCRTQRRLSHNKDNDWLEGDPERVSSRRAASRRVRGP